MKGKKILALSLAVLLLTALLPTVAFAAGSPGLAQGTSVLSEGANTSGAATVYYGGKTWRVIAYNSGSITLLAAESFGNTAYDSSGNDSNVYGTSTLKTAIEAIAAGFTSGEQSAVIPRILEGGSANCGVMEGESVYNDDHISGDPVENALLWPLSVAEAKSLDKELRKVDPAQPSWLSSDWWLRSPGSKDWYAAIVNGNVNGNGVVADLGAYVRHSEFGFRPAFYLNLESVLFTSAAEGGKSCTEGALTQIGTNTNNEWKVTLKDEDRTFTAKAVSEIIDNSIDIEYSSKDSEGEAIYGTNEYISAVVEDSDGNITYYGRLQNVAAEGDAEGTLTVNLPEGWSDADTLYVFSEQYNGDKLTDYASALQEITVPESVTLTFDLCGGTLDGKTGSVTVNAVVGQKINLPGAPTKEGCKFLYWKGSQYDAGAEYTVEGPHDFTAEWEESETENPKTGDNGNTGLWSALLGGSLLAVILLITAGRKYLKKQR